MGMGGKHRNWEDETNRRLIVFLYKEGYPLTKIARLCDCDPGTIKNRLTEWGHYNGKV